VKRTGGTAAGVKVKGPVYGLIFVSYVLLVILVASDKRCLKQTVLALLCAVIPLGGFIADARSSTSRPQPSRKAHPASLQVRQHERPVGDRGQRA